MAEIPSPPRLLVQLGYVVRGKALDMVLGFERWIRARWLREPDN